jgi:hypothetical protein
MAYKIDFVGLVCFLNQGDTRLALLPDGRNPGGGISPHNASVIIKSGDFVSSDNWPDFDDSEVRTFAIDEPSVLSISGLAGQGVDATQHDQNTPRLSNDGSLVIDPDKAITIARLSIRAGTLQAFQLELGVVSQLEVDHTGEVIITATWDGGIRTLTLKEGAEIVLVNLSEDRTGGSDETAHFHIYKQLTPGQTGTVSTPNPDFTILAELHSDHPFMKPAFTEFPGRNCSNLAAS